MAFELLDLKPRNPFVSVALDEALCRFVAREGGVGGLRLWSNPTSIILGRTCEAHKNLNDPEERLLITHKKSNWNNRALLCRRASGGGTVLHGPGNLNYSVFVSLKHSPDMFSLKHSYSRLLEMVQRALDAQGIATDLRGQSDLVLAGADGVSRKISGNAQFRKHNVLVLHGTLITRPDLIERISEHLKHPPKEPDYRAGRNHRSFLGSLPDSFDLSAFYSCFAREFRQLLGVERLTPLGEAERREVYRSVRELVYRSYASRDWILHGKGNYGTPSHRAAVAPPAAGASIGGGAG
ncbi:MAG: lipoate--protein ligase family protein [bacterium]|nr:lipoate--protein ligase family protein [bacterium]